MHLSNPNAPMLAARCLASAPPDHPARREVGVVPSLLQYEAHLFWIVLWAAVLMLLLGVYIAVLMLLGVLSGLAHDSSR